MTKAGLITRTQVQYNHNDGSTAQNYRTVTATQPDGSKTVSVHHFGRLLSVTRRTGGGTQLSRTTYDYDPHGRTW